MTYRLLKPEDVEVGDIYLIADKMGGNIFGRIVPTSITSVSDYSFNFRGLGEDLFGYESFDRPWEPPRGVLVKKSGEKLELLVSQSFLDKLEKGPLEGKGAKLIELLKSNL